MANVLKTIRTGDDYIQSLRGRDLVVYLFGELVKEPVDHPMISSLPPFTISTIKTPFISAFLL